MSETPFFYFYFTNGGRPIKLSACSTNQKGSVKVDLVLATLETKHDLNAVKNQQKQHRRVERNPGRQDDGEGDQQQQQQEPMSARHSRGDDQVDQKNVKLLVDKGHRREGEGAHSGSSGGRSRPVCVDESSAPPRDADADDAEFIPRNHSRDRQHTAPAHTHSNGEDQSHGSKSSKRRLKRLLDSSSDEEGG